MSHAFCRANHRHAVVYNQCTNKLLEHAIQTAKGLSPRPLRSLDEVSCEDLPPMPQPGDVEFICGGESDDHVLQLI